MKKLLPIVVILAIFTAASVFSAEFKLDVKEYHLDNGLTILLLENHSAPVISYYTFFKVGSRNESRYNSGISHFFEHMMFNGSEKYGPKMFDLTLEANGGYSNAYTSKNVTAYYEDFSSDNLEIVLDLESDRMAHLSLDSAMVLSERGVVYEERLVSTDNDYGSLVYEELFATAYDAHSYQSPVLGWAKSIQNFNRKDCVEYFKTYYAPNNAVVAIVGDFKADEAFQLMKKYFDHIPSGPPPKAVVNFEPEQRGAKRVTLEKPVQFIHFMRGYHVGDKDSPDLPVLEVIQNVLVTGESSRIYQALVNDLQISLGCYGGFEWGFDPSLFYFYVAGIPGQELEVIENSFDSVLTDFVTNGITEEELQKAKNRLVAGFYKNFKTNNGTAHELANYRTLYGDYNELYQFPEKIKAVTIDDVKTVAAKYFTKTNSTTSVAIPEGGQQ